MMAAKRGFASEEELVKRFAERVDNVVDTWRYRKWARMEQFELAGLFGRPDFTVSFLNEGHTNPGVVVTFAFEGKIREWGKALRQAYRYKSFAEYVYVVMDETYVAPALRQLSRFHNANIGLISVDQDGIVSIHARARKDEPYSERLRRQLQVWAEEGRLNRSPGWESG